MNDEGECYGYDILNNCSARQLNYVKDRFAESWFTKGKVGELLLFHAYRRILQD